MPGRQANWRLDESGRRSVTVAQAVACRYSLHTPAQPVLENAMSDTLTLPEADADTAPRTRRSAGGREAKRAARSARVVQSAPYITRKIP